MSEDLSFWEASKITILRQGKVRVSSASKYVVKESGKPGIAICEIDLLTKYADLLTTSDGCMRCNEEGEWVATAAPNLYLDVSESSLYLLEEAEGGTEIALDDFFNWKIYDASCCRYTVRVCLTEELV